MSTPTSGWTCVTLTVTREDGGGDTTMHAFTPTSDRPACDDVGPILIVVLAYPAGCGGERRGTSGWMQYAKTHSLLEGNEFLPHSSWSVRRILLVPFFGGTRIPFFWRPKKGILGEFLGIPQECTT